MTIKQTAHRHPWTDRERQAYLACLAVSHEWVYDMRFIDQLSRCSTLTSKQSKRLFRLAGALKETPSNA